jgi:hypothetical protein
LSRQTTILAVVLALLLSAVGTFAQEQAQDQLPPERMKELRKFDPVDIEPGTRESEPRGREDGRRRTQSRRTVGSPASSAPLSAAVDSILPTQAAPASRAPVSSRTSPSAAPNGAVVITQSEVTKTRPSGPKAPAASVNRSASSAGLPLPLMFFLIGLISLALVAVAVKLKKDMSKR